jgi:hypothetical protein
MNMAARIETGLTERVQFIPMSEIAQMEQALAKLKALVPNAASGDTTGETARPVLQRGNKKEPKMSDTLLAYSTSNLITLDDMLVLARESGEAEARGQDSLPQFLLKVTEASFVGALDLTANKHGPGIDDATRLTAERVKARTHSNVFDRRALNQRVACNRTRTMAKLGMFTKGGPGEPLSTLNRLLTLRDKASKMPATQKRVIDAANAMINYARAQVRLDHVCNETDLEQFFLKPDHDKPTEEQFLEATRKRLQAGKVGKGLNGAIDADTADKAIAAITKRLKAIAVAKGASNGGAAAAAQATP